jgi:hypothetical protein
MEKGDEVRRQKLFKKDYFTERGVTGNKRVLQV